MKFSNFRKNKNQYEIDGVCDFCKKEFSGSIIIGTSLYTRLNIFNRPKSNGAIFLWNTPGPTRKDIEDYLAGKDLIKIKYITKVLTRFKKEVSIRFGFPKLMLACPGCFRKDN
ncbi:MAG: hypothetical protein ACFFDY_00310 [Candidatus Thorarchaeota archaeon]